jgi:uncharacterized membrane protein
MPDVNDLRPVLAFSAALGCGLIAGVFFAFSAFVMRAFGRLSPSQGIAAMQSVNVAVLNPVFLSVFMGTAALCVVAIVFAFLRWQAPGAAYLLAGGLLYLIGTFLVTVAFNVPRNDALAAVAPTDPESARLWASYLSSWTAWNHVRTAAALLASAAFTLAFRSGAGSS